jgi:uncharacterized protein
VRAFFWFIGLIAVGFAAMAALAYPAWLLLHPHFDFPFHRIASRIGYLTLAIGIVPLLRRLHLNNRRDLGYARPLPLFAREVGIAFALGLATMLPVALIMSTLGLVQLRPDVALDVADWARVALQAALTALFVSVGEETFTRGAMYSAIARESGAAWAVALTALVYASLHFVARVHIAPDQVTSSSGFALLGASFESYAHPLAILDAFLCLAAVGALLGLLRKLAGDIAPCIGLHAGWVFVITVLRETTDPVRSNPWSWLLSQFDGVVGWLVLGWTLLIGALLYRLYARRAQAAHSAVTAQPA